MQEAQTENPEMNNDQIRCDDARCARFVSCFLVLHW